MSNSTSDRRLAENEVYFKQSNEKVNKDLEKLKKLAESDGNHDLLIDFNQPFHFFCECADEKCHQRVKLTTSEYRKSRKNNKQFILAVGHDLKGIEKVQKKKKDFVVVEKFINIPPAADHLNATNLSNA